MSSLLPLLSEGPPLLAAGGLSNGAQIASFLTLGAAGAVLGTRFLLTPQSLYTDTQKAALLAATSSSTMRSTAFDQARDVLGWPAGVDGRGLRNQLVQDLEGGTDLATVRARFAEGVKRGGDPEYSVIWAGTGVGEMREIKGAQVGHAVASCQERADSVCRTLCASSTGRYSSGWERRSSFSVMRRVSSRQLRFGNPWKMARS